MPDETEEIKPLPAEKSSLVAIAVILAVALALLVLFLGFAFPT